MIESFRELFLVLVILVCRGGRIWCIFIITNKGVKAGIEGRKAVHRPGGPWNYSELAPPCSLGLSVWVGSAFLTASLQSVLPVWEPHFENQCPYLSRQ